MSARAQSTGGVVGLVAVICHWSSVPLRYFAACSRGALDADAARCLAIYAAPAKMAPSSRRTFAPAVALLTDLLFVFETYNKMDTAVMATTAMNLRRD